MHRGVGASEYIGEASLVLRRVSLTPQPVLFPCWDRQTDRLRWRQRSLPFGLIWCLVVTLRLLLSVSSPSLCLQKAKRRALVLEDMAVNLLSGYSARTWCFPHGQWSSCLPYCVFILISPSPVLSPCTQPAELVMSELAQPLTHSQPQMKRINARTAPFAWFWLLLCDSFTFSLLLVIGSKCSWE